MARKVTGIALLGAAAIHVAAASAHAEHPAIAAFFALLAAAQCSLAAASLSSGAFSAIAVVMVNAVAVGTWLLSRTTGLPFIADARSVEPAGFPDATATLLELVAITAAGIGRRVGALLPVPVVSRAAATGMVSMSAIVVTFGAAVGALDLRESPHAHEPGPSSVAAGGNSHSQAHAAGGEEDRTAAGHDHEAAVGPSASPTADGHRHSVAAAADGHADHPTIAGAQVGHAATPSSTSPSPAVTAGRDPGTPATVRYGPFVLPPAGVSEAAHVNIVLADAAKPCADCYLTTLRPDLVYLDGARANYDTGAMLHHAVWSQEGRADATCGRRANGERFFASGNERTAIALPDGFGIHITRARWNLIVEVMNHSPASQTVYVQLDVHHRPASDASTTSVRPVWLDVANCQGSQYAVPAGPHEAQWRWTSSITGRIVATGGHVHDSGTKTILRNETTDRDVCTSWAGYRTDPSYQGSLESMTTCVWDRIGTVRAGEVLGLRSHYDSAEPQDDVMGIMLAYIYETSDLAGGTEPPSPSPPPSGAPPPRRHDH